MGPTPRAAREHCGWGGESRQFQFFRTQDSAPPLLFPDLLSQVTSSLLPTACPTQWTGLANLVRPTPVVLSFFAQQTGNATVVDFQGTHSLVNCDWKVLESDTAVILHVVPGLFADTALLRRVPPLMETRTSQHHRLRPRPGPAQETSRGHTAGPSVVVLAGPGQWATNKSPQENHFWSLLPK